LLPPVAAWFAPNGKTLAIYAVFLVLAYLAMCLAAKAYGMRLVQNSLAVASR
jgi:hypothetical protein